MDQPKTDLARSVLPNRCHGPPAGQRAPPDSSAKTTDFQSLRMHLRGACSNPQVVSRVEAAARASLRVVTPPLAVGVPTRQVLRLPMGAIQAAAIAAFSGAGTPMRPREVRSAVERRLDRRVSQDTVSSFLSVAARRTSTPIERVGPGLYTAQSDSRPASSA